MLTSCVMLSEKVTRLDNGMSVEQRRDMAREKKMKRKKGKKEEKDR